MRRNAEHALGEKGSLRGQGQPAESGTRLAAIRNWILPTTWRKLDVDSSLEFPAQSADTWVPAFWNPPQGIQSSRVLATGPTREVPGYMFLIPQVSLTSSYRFEKFYKEKSIHLLSLYCQGWGLPEIFMGHLKKKIMIPSEFSFQVIITSVEAIPPQGQPSITWLYIKRDYESHK